MKRVFAIWVAISLVCYICFNGVLNWQAYLTRLQSLPSPIYMFQDFVATFRAVGDYFSSIRNFNDVLKAIFSIFTCLWNIIRLPFNFVGYIINVIMVLLPIGVIS